MRKLLLVLFLATNSAYCWNALGHRLVVQIAYHHLTRQAKQQYNHYNHALDTRYRPQSLVNAAVWLDTLHAPDEVWLQPKHYINLPFSLDGSRLIPPNKINAVSAIEEAKTVLGNKSATDFEKGFNLRILLHVVADIHQPLHAASQYSRAYPKGDKGGNLFYLQTNPVATNLHAYWDKGGGFLSTKKSYSKSQLNRKASQIEKHWPCHVAAINLDPKKWANESHKIAVKNAYQIKSRQKPDKNYQKMTKLITEQRIALAGCRLASLLNKIASL
ncbi:S1/P1 nuclease [Legionella fairfieldensis]|uniref:S1/P1 nuclease n=1 Tax=Legionella fairfieldensis TaxID=45064 RepID=UPI0004919ABF|nr:S1/P1 nuclease [Legionella fairfieldensis]